MEIKTLAHSDVLDILPDRKNDTHKGDYGKILLLCGARGYTGAAALAALGALRVGAGLVYLGVPECIYEIEAKRLLETIVLPLPDDGTTLSADALEEISVLLNKVDVVVIGCGLGQSAGTERVTKHVLSAFNGVVVLDADAINVIKNQKEYIRDRKGLTVLTPHDGEYARLAGHSVGENRMGAAAELANDLNAIVALKGHKTIITDGENAYINNTGNPGMAVGGSGDVLAGMIGGLVGQKIPPLEATACAVWIHGAAGDICAKEIGQYGMLPGDMLQSIPKLMK